MKAIVHERYGPPSSLELHEVDGPAVAAGQVLVRVRASSVNPINWYVVTGFLPARIGGGLRRPKERLVGSDLAGVVEAVGAEVTALRPGDEVFGTARGAWAEYVAADPAKLAPKPAGVSFEDAAAAPIAGLTALQALRDHGHVEPGQKVLVNGASGGVGTYAVQLAKHFGAEVTAVCSTAKVELVRSLGADHVVDYTREDFTRRGGRYDLLLDVAGSRPLRALRRVLTPNATVVVIGGPKGRFVGPLPHIVGMRLAGIGRSQKVAFFVAEITTEDLRILGELLEAGAVRSAIDGRYELSQIAAALDHLGRGHTSAKVVVTV